MTTETSGTDDVTESGGPAKTGGLVSGHAYTLLKLMEYEPDGIWLLNIWNPWGRFEWDGAWCDNAPEWEDKYVQYFKPVFDINDGSFWMAYDDYLEHFTSVNICKARPWEEIWLKGKFIWVKEVDNPDIGSED